MKGDAAALPRHEFCCGESPRLSHSNYLAPASLQLLGAGPFCRNDSCAPGLCLQAEGSGISAIQDLRSREETGSVRGGAFPLLV
jgi:hypothetical protein